ncbi:hypothetical protein [Tannerella sp.]|uniref:hypothetical protein n=1 Tax=Tannerella sp. TaxID=2382127 RepID=UPI0026DB2399|nr:hypothetical protein [Tannerella sp.]MDO4702691.1 hypothetical protein [Tannerella sp.]
MKSKRMFLYIGVLAALAFAWGCNEEDMESTAAGTSLKVYNIYNSGCLSNIRSEEAEAAFSDLYETLRLKAVEGGRLQIAHDSVIYNCAAKLEVRVTQNGDQLWVKEKDVSKSSVRCLCPYNLKYEIPLRHGTYTIRINDGTTYMFTHHATTDTVIFLSLSMKNDLSF